MATTAELAFADRAGSFYAREYGFPPVTGRLLGYLIVCDPAQQTIADLAEALMASRSAITGAVKSLEGYHAVRRTRAAGDRVDRISIDPAAGLAPKGFDAALYREQAELAREALDLLSPDAPGAPPGRAGGGGGLLRLPGPAAARGARGVAGTPESEITQICVISVIAVESAV